MGDSRPPRAQFDLVGSFARLRGGDLEIVLAEPETDLAGPAVTMRLTRGGRSFDVPATVADTGGGRRLTVRVPRSQLTDGTWSLRVARPTGRFSPIPARLLVQGQRPLVLLWGSKGEKSQIPKERPGPRQRARRTGSRLVRRALAKLPAQHAARLRATARTVSRRVPGGTFG